MSSFEFDRDYFEDGINAGVSWYENYRWMPERSFVEAHWFVVHTSCPRSAPVVDFGCAKGYWVKAMRLLGYRAYGVDISEYAIEHSDSDTRQYLECARRPGRWCEYGYCKDVLEHSQDPADLLLNIATLAESAPRWLIIVPVTDEDGHYLAPEYEIDRTHRIRYTSEQWLTEIEKRFTIDWHTHRLEGFKSNWAHYPEANLFVMAHHEYCSTDNRS